MKKKKLLVSLVIVAIIVVIIVVIAAICTVRDNVYFSYHKFDGNLTPAPDEDAVPTKVIEEFARGKSVVFLSKTKLLTQINAKLRAEYPQWYAFAVEKSFPNVLNVHLVKVTPIAKLTDSNGAVIYVDSFGCKVAEAPEYECINITHAIDDRTVVETQDNTLKFASAESNERLQYIIQAILATWQCYVDIDDMPIVLSTDNAFEFKDGSMLIHPSSGGTIKLLSPETTDPDLATRLQKAYGVYYNSQVNLQGDEWVITVDKNGKVKTPDPNK